MKKLLSAVLCVMMLVSLFTVTANASIVTGEPEETIYLIDQNYQDADNADFTAVEYSASEVVVEAEESDNKVLRVVAGEDTTNKMYSNVASVTSISADEYVIEFDAKAVNPTSAIDVFVKLADDAAFAPYGYVLRITYSNFRNAADWSIDSNWYTYRITVNAAKLRVGGILSEGKTYGNYSIKRAVKGTDVWETVAYNHGYNAVSKEVADKTAARRVGFRLLYNTETSTYSTTTDAGVSLCWSSSSSSEGFAFTDTEYLLDNFKVSYVKEEVEYPTTGIIVSEDFEGENPLFVGGKATLMQEADNSYIDLYLATKAADTYNEEKGTYKAVHGNSAEVKSTIVLPQNFVFTADICMQEDNTQNFYFEYFTDTLGTTNDSGSLLAGEANNFVINKDDVVAGKWYTVKVAKIGFKKFTATIKDIETGEEQSLTLTNQWNISGADGYNRIMFRIINGSVATDTTTHWLIDNVQVNKVAAASLANATVADATVSATLNVDTNTAEAVVAVALYKEGRLVDVDYNPVATAGFRGAEVEIEASGDYDKVVCFIWDGGLVPIMDVPWDITEIIAE